MSKAASILKSTKVADKGCLPEKIGSSTPRFLRSVKIQDRHLERLAIVYVRQSSPQQVVENQESRARQYALADHAIALGWPKDRVLVIDEDQGQSGRCAEQRTGFQRLLAEVTLDHVGIILGLEMSRLARSSKDWHSLLELCALFQTLLADQDGIYNPNDTNDRLLLGLKGTMSEFELFTMRNRLQRGSLHKAERGELFTAVPCGYVKLSSGQVALEPDEQARAVVQLLFAKFEELGALNRVFRYLIDNKIDLGMRIHSGARRGELAWCRPSLATLSQMMHHPIYAGAYVYGRRPKDPKRKPFGGPQGKQRWLPMEQWKVLIRDRLPAYITWERYLANLEQLRRNRSRADSPGVPRPGEALLAGLLMCGTCGWRLQPSYRCKAQPFYICPRHLLKATQRTCFGLKAAVIDDLVAQQVLQALQPAALELSVQAAQDIDCERQRLHQHWHRQLERIRFEAQRAERQYQAVEPENRLVARTLEQRWEQALAEQRRLEEEYHRFQTNRPAQLSDEERDRIKALASDMPALWHGSGLSAADRKEVIRCLVEKVVVHVKKNSEYVDATIHWQGGFTSQHEIVRPVKLYEQLRDYDQLVERIVALRRQGQTSSEIAQTLKQEGFHPPKRRGDFHPVLIRKLLSRRGLTNEKTYEDQLAPNEWWLADLARELAMRPAHLRTWMDRGWLHCRQTPAQSLWIAWADRSEIKRLRKMQALSCRGNPGYPPELTIPKKKAVDKKTFVGPRKSTSNGR